MALRPDVIDLGCPKSKPRPSRAASNIHPGLRPKQRAIRPETQDAPSQLEAKQLVARPTPKSVAASNEVSSNCDQRASFDTKTDSTQNGARPTLFRAAPKEHINHKRGCDDMVERSFQYVFGASTSTPRPESGAELSRSPRAYARDPIVFQFVDDASEPTESVASAGEDFVVNDASSDRGKGSMVNEEEMDFVRGDDFISDPNARVPMPSMRARDQGHMVISSCESTDHVGMDLPPTYKPFKSITA